MPELLAVLADLDAIDPDDAAELPPRLPALEQLLARAERVAAPADWRRFVLERLGLVVDGEELPLGATVAAAAGLRADSGTWLFATPLHLLATLSDVRLHPAGPLPLDAARASAIAERLTAGCADPGFTVHAVGDTLLAHFDDALDVLTTDPAPHAGRRVDVQLPRGRDGGRLRRRMTELQMILHAATARPDELPVNAVWLWGGGRVPPAGRATWPTVASEDAFLGALRRLDGGRVDRPDARLVTWRLASLAERGDAFELADAEWFGALANDLARRRVDRATVHFAGRAYELRPAQRWRFWVPPRPWWELAA
jgi:hypothetical protein